MRIEVVGKSIDDNQGLRSESAFFASEVSFMIESANELDLLIEIINNHKRMSHRKERVSYSLEGLILDITIG